MDLTTDRVVHEVRTPDGRVVLRGQGAGFIDTRARVRLPDGDYEQYLSLDGGETWKNPLYLSRTMGQWRIKPCTKKVPRLGGFQVSCGLPLGHTGSCA
jgi:hypothetical protein